MADGVNPLDPLGPIVGSLGQPSLDPNSYLPFEGEVIKPHVINFPDPGGDRRNTIGTPGIVSRPKSKLTKEDVRALNNSIINNLSNKISSGRTKDEFATYQTYDAGPDSNAFYDRYMAYGQEKFDQVGFHPFRDNEANFNANTTWWDDFKRMTTHSFLPLVGLGFKAGPKSLLKMLNGDFTGSDLNESREYERAAAIGQSSKDGVGAFFNNTLMNFGYTAGIVTEIIAEEFVLGVGTALTGGGLTGAAALRTAKNVERGAEAVSTFSKMYDRTRKMVNSFGNINAARQFWKAANSKAGRFINPLENTFEGVNQLRKASKAGNQIDGLAVLSKTAGGFYRDVRTINMAVSEARLEAGMVENHLLDGYYSEFYAQNNRAPDEKEIKDMQALAKKGSLETFYTNAGLIYLTNKITFNNITGPRGGVRNFMQSTMDDIYTIGSRAGEKNFGDIGKILYDNTKKEFVFRANNLKNLAKSWWKEPGVKTLAKTVGYFKANVSEGIQENLQETIARANEKYYNEAFKNSNLLKGQLYANGVNKLGYKDVNGIFNTPLEYYKEELGKEFSKQGAETFASGFLMGTFASPLNNAMPFLSTQWNRMYNKEQYQKWKDMKLDISKNIVQQLNSVDMNEFLNNRVVNLSSQDIINNIKKNGSYKEAYDAEVESYVRSVGTMLRTGTTDVFINKLKSYNDLTDEELIDAVKGSDIKDAPMYRERIDKAVSKLEKIQKKYDQAEEKFPNPINLYNLDKNKMSAIEYNQYVGLYNAWEEAKFNYVYFNEAFEDTAKRMKNIERDYLQGSSLQNVEYGSAKNLFRPGEIKQDIANLETELELERSKGESKFDLTTDGLTRQRIKLLEQQIADLKAYDEAYNKFNRFYNRGEVLTTEVEIELEKELGRKPTPEEIADRINDIEGDETNQDKQIEILSALKDAHDNYLRNLAKNSKSTVFQENLDDAFEKLLDHYKLGREAEVMARSIDILNDPKGYADLVAKNLSFMRRLYDNRSEFFEQMVNEQIEMIENNALLNALANEGLFVSADDFAEYIKTGRPPSEIYDHARKVVYKEGTEMYDKIYKEYFVKNEQLKNQSISVTPTFVDETYQKKYEDLYEEAQRKIDALPKEIRRVNKGVVKPLKGKTMSLTEVLEQMEPQEYVELNYEGDEGVPVKFYLDENGVLRVDGPAGGIIDIVEDTTAEFTEGVRYTEELAPDPVAVEQIQNDLKQKIDDLVENYKEDKAIEEESGKTDAFVPLSTDTDIEDFPTSLRKKLEALYDDYLKTTMSEEDYVNMSKDEYESGFNTFVKSGSASIKEAINKYNKSQEVDSVVRTKGIKDDFEFEYAGKTYNTKDLDVPTIRSYQRQIRNNIDTLSKTDPIVPSLEALIVNLDKVANKKLLSGFTEAQSSAIKKIQELKAKQKDYKVDSTGYTIAGDFYKRVTQIIQPLKSKKQSYKDAAKVEQIFNNTFAVNGFNLNSINNFISELRDKKLSGFSEFTYKELEEELKSLLAKGEEVFIPINRDAQIKSLIENFEPDTIDEISEIGVNENNKIVAIINGQNYTKEDLEESSKDPRAAKNKALFTKLINEVNRLQKLLDDQITAIPKSTTTTTTDKNADIEQYFSENTKSTKDSKYKPDLSGEGSLALMEQENRLLELGADRIQAHGMAKGSVGEQFKDLLNILTNGLDPNRGGGMLYSAPLVLSKDEKAGVGAALGTGGGTAYIDGAFIILGKKGVNTIKSIDDIGGVLVNQAVADTLPELINKLKTLFPNLAIDSYSNAPNVIAELATLEGESKNVIPNFYQTVTGEIRVSTGETGSRIVDITYKDFDKIISQLSPEQTEKFKEYLRTEIEKIPEKRKKAAKGSGYMTSNYDTTQVLKLEKELRDTLAALKDTQDTTQVSTEEPKSGNQTFAVPISKKEDISKVVAGPLLPASEIFWDKNIRTTGSWIESIQGKTSGQDYIEIAYDSLSEENKKIADKLKESDNNYGGIKGVRIVLGNNLSAEEAQKKSIEIANEFKQQDLLWYKPITLQDTINSYEESKQRNPRISEAVDQEIQRVKNTWGQELKPGQYFDTSTKTIWASKELYDKSKGITTQPTSEESINLLQEVQNIVLEKTYEASRIVGNYIDNAVKNLFDKGIFPVKDNTKISDEAYESLFGVDGYLTELKKLHDSGEVYIASQGLVVFDKELGIAGEIDLLVADRKGNIFIVDIKTGEKSKWDNFNKKESQYSKLEEYNLQQTAYANLLNRMIGVNPGTAILPIQIVKDTETGKIESGKRPSTPDLLSPDSKFLIKLDKNLVQDKINTVIPLIKTAFKDDTTADIFEDEDIETTDDDQTSPIKDAIDENEVPTEVISEKEKAIVKELLDEIYTSGSKNIKAIRGKITILNYQDELSSESLDTLYEAIRRRETELEEEPEEAITLDMLKEGTELIAKNDVYIDKKTPYVKQGESIKIISINNDGTVNFVKLIGKRPTKQKDYSMKKLNANFEISKPISKPDVQKDNTMTDLDKDYVKKGGDIVSNFLNSKDDLARVEKDLENKSIKNLDDEFFDEDNLICE